MFSRNRISFAATILLAVIFTSTNSRSARIDLSLRETLLSAKSDEIIPVLALMKDRPDIAYLEELVRGLPRKERTTEVWNELVRLSDITQTGLIRFLDEEQNRGRVQKYKSLRICNGVIVRAVPDVIRELSYRNDVCRILDDSEREHPVVKTGGELDDPPWYIHHINAHLVWADGYTGQGVLVAIIDTGVDYTFPDLQDHLWDGGDEYPNHGYDFYNEDDDPMDESGHGTGVALIVAGDGTQGDTSGVAPDVTLMILKVRQNLSTGRVTDTWLAQDFVLEHGVDLTQMSLGWGSPGEGDRPVWRSNYDVLNTAGIVNVKSAGNNRGARYPPDAISVPGGVPSPWRSPDEVEEGTRSGLITVGASTQADEVSSISSPGPVTWMDIAPFFDYPLDTLAGQVGLIKPDLVAPGSATSYSAPVVSGVVALMLSKDYWLSPVEIDSILEISALDLGTPGKDNDYGAGRVRADSAVGLVTGLRGTFSVTPESLSVTLPANSEVIRLLTLGNEGLVDYDVRLHVLAEDETPGMEGVTLSRDEFTVMTGAEEMVYVRFESYGLEAGEYAGNILAEHSAIGEEGRIPLLFTITHEDSMDQSPFPSSYSIDASYPNPISSKTRIWFSAPYSEIIKVKLYNILGQEVAVLEERKYDAGCNMISLTIEVDNLSNGIYFLALSTGSGVQAARKVVFLKSPE